MSLLDNPELLGAYVTQLGGTPIPGRTFRFEMPLAETRRIIPEINKLGAECTRISERTGVNINGKTQTLTTIEISRRQEKSPYEQERGLMSALIR